MRRLFCLAMMLVGCGHPTDFILAEELSPMYAAIRTRPGVVVIRPPVGPSGRATPFAAEIHKLLLDYLDGPSRFPVDGVYRLVMPRHGFKPYVGIGVDAPVPSHAGVIITPRLDSRLLAWELGGQITLSGSVEARTPQGQLLHSTPFNVTHTVGGEGKGETLQAVTDPQTDESLHWPSILAVFGGPPVALQLEHHDQDLLRPSAESRHDGHTLRQLADVGCTYEIMTPKVSDEIAFSLARVIWGVGSQTGRIPPFPEVADPPDASDASLGADRRGSATSAAPPRVLRVP